METFEHIILQIREIFQQHEGIIPLHAPIFIGNERKYIEECIQSTYVSSVGKFVDQFENGIAQYLSAKKAVVCDNGTNALHLGLQLVGVGVGHEVITQPLTFVATANAIAYCHAQPVFVDVDIDTMGLSPQSLFSFLETQTVRTGKTQRCVNRLTGRPISACVPMHTFGHPCRIDEIADICQHYNIPVVEDAAESLGSRYKGQCTGTFGKVGVLSFNGNKILTTGGGWYVGLSR